jgi:uncharacterized membrane protein YphA (DoxX/SURF4 family)
MSKRNKIIYWVATLWLSAGMLATGVQQLFQMEVDGAVSPPGAYGMRLLGYPLYFLTIIGVWKILGVIALLVPRFPLVKEWAYAGFVFLLTGAIYSHIATGNPPKELFPSVLLLVLTGISWYLRPAERKIVTLA